MKFWKKKPKGPYPRSFAKRLTWRIMLRMILIMILPVFLLFWMGYGVVFSGIVLLGDRLVKGEYQTIRRVTSDLYVAATNTAPIIEENLDKPDKMHGYMQRLLKLNPYIRSCGISFRENYYPQKGRWFCPYVLRRDSTAETHTLGDQGYDYLQADWFRKAIKSRKGYWGEVFLDSTDNNTPVVSYMLPIRDSRDSAVAVLTVDLSLGWLGNKIQFGKDSNEPADSSKVITTLTDEKGNKVEVKANKDKKQDEPWNAEYEAYYFMVDSTGTFLIHPDMQRVARRNIQSCVTADPDSAIASLLALDDDEAYDITIDGEKVFVFFTPVKYTNWSFGMVLPAIFSEIFGYMLGGFFIFIILVGLLVVWFLGRRTIKKATRPLQQLASSADEVAKGHFDTELPVMTSHDEIHQLRDSFENMQRSLTRYVEDLKDTTAQKASIESELNIAHNIQMSMLPKIFPPYPERSDIDIFGQQKPAKAVGGDLFDFYIRDNHLFFCIGDVSGKGVPASLVMAVTRTLFRNVSGHAMEPQVIVNAINEGVCAGNDLNMFVTLFVGVLDLQTGQLDYCNAGHDAPIMLADEVSQLPCDPNLPVGIMADWAFTLQQTTISRGTTIFLYTDGLNEAENNVHHQFGDARMVSLAETLLNRGDRQPAKLIGCMTDAIRDFVGDAEQSDDLTMLAIQYK